MMVSERRGTPCRPLPYRPVPITPDPPVHGSPRVSAIVVGASSPDLAATLTALAAQTDLPDEVIVAAGWPGPEPHQDVLATLPAARVVQEGGVGAAAAANAAIASATGEILLLLAAGDIPAVDLVQGHRRAHGEGAEIVAGIIDGAVPARDAWVGLRPAGCPAWWCRHVSISRARLSLADGLDDRLRDLDVATLDLLVRLDAMGLAVSARPDLRVAAGPRAGTASDAETAGRSAQLLDTLLAARNAPTRSVGPRAARAGLRWARPFARLLAGRVALRAAFARGRGLPPLPAFDADRMGLTRTDPAVERPAVSVIVPFAGGTTDAQTLLAGLDTLRCRPGDEIIIVDNSVEPVIAQPSVRVVRAAGERSSYHARNVGAQAAASDWLLFMDADCVPVPQLLDAFFSPPPGAATGAVAGAVLDPQEAGTWIARYSTDAAVLSQGRALARTPPYAVTACLLVRREALAQDGGFAEGIRSSGDVDLCWRLHTAGWGLEHRPRAAVEHRHRASLRGLLGQYAKYGAGGAWLAVRWPEYTPTDWPRIWRPATLGAVVRDLLAARPRAALTRALDLVCEWAAVWGARSDNTPPPVPDGAPRDHPIAAGR